MKTKKVLVEFETMWADEPILYFVSKLLSKSDIGKIKDIKVLS